MRSIRTVAIAFVVGVLAAPAVATAATGVAAPYIVVFRDGAVMPIGSTNVDRSRVESAASELARSGGFVLNNVYGTALGGFSAGLTPGQRAAVAADPRVASVTPDASVTLSDGPHAAETLVSLASPKLPAGIRRVGADRSDIANINGRDGRVDVDVAVIDTGIDGHHPDLNVVGGYNCTSSNRDAWSDGNGHGTHVAGTIGALDNGSGVVGVAPGARLWAIKVLVPLSDGSSGGLLSWIIC